MRERHLRLGAVLPALVTLGGCILSYSGPVPLQSGTPCAFCRMTIADTRVGAELMIPHEEPRQYDDIGCLVNDLERQPPPAGSLAFVAEYSTGELIAAPDAVYTRLPALETPMGSHLVAHRHDAARRADARARDGQALTVRDVFGPRGAPGGSHGR